MGEGVILSGMMESLGNIGPRAKVHLIMFSSPKASWVDSYVKFHEEFEFGCLTNVSVAVSAQIHEFMNFYAYLISSFLSCFWGWIYPTFND